MLKRFGIDQVETAGYADRDPRRVPVRPRGPRPHGALGPRDGGRDHPARDQHVRRRPADVRRRPRGRPTRRPRLPGDPVAAPRRPARPRRVPPAGRPAQRVRRARPGRRRPARVPQPRLRVRDVRGRAGRLTSTSSSGWSPSWSSSSSTCTGSPWRATTRSTFLRCTPAGSRCGTSRTGPGRTWPRPTSARARWTGRPSSPRARRPASSTPSSRPTTRRTATAWPSRADSMAYVEALR